MSKQGSARLAKAVLERRTALGLSQGAVQGNGGPSVTTINKIENQRMDEVQALTLKKLDDGLGWPTGYAAAIYNGKKVTPIDDTELFVRHQGDRTAPSITNEELLLQVLALRQEVADLKKERERP